AFMEDLKAAMQFYLEKPREARQLLIDQKMVRVNPDVYLTMHDYYRDPTLRVDADALEQMQATQIKAGFQKKKADVRSLVDLSYRPKWAWPGMPATMPLLEVTDLDKTFTVDSRSVAALDHLSLSIDEREFVSIVGPSGCGKSTFLHIIGGFEP